MSPAFGPDRALEREAQVCPTRLSRRHHPQAAAALSDRKADIQEPVPRSSTSGDDCPVAQARWGIKAEPPDRLTELFCVPIMFSHLLDIVNRPTIGPEWPPRARTMLRIMR